MHIDQEQVNQISTLLLLLCWGSCCTDAVAPSKPWCCAWRTCSSLSCSTHISFQCMTVISAGQKRTSEGWEITFEIRLMAVPLSPRQ